MMNELPAIASAIAASFSAIAAITVMNIQRNNVIDAASPEILIDDWERKKEIIGDREYDVLIFRKVTNAGKGSALHVNINLINSKQFLAGLSTVVAPIIPPGGNINTNGKITLYWDNLGNDEYISIKLLIFCWSSQNVRYQTTYNLIIGEMNSNFLFGGGHEVAPTVFLTTRHSKSESVKYLKLKRYISNYRYSIIKLLTRIRKL